MDHSLHDDLCNKDVAYYERMEARGEPFGLIAEFLDTQLTELVETCERYVELDEWAKCVLGIPEGGKAWRDWRMYLPLVSTIVNEHGNEIKVTVTPIPGGTVRVDVVGPTSTCVNTWTRNETRVIATLMGGSLGLNFREDEEVGKE